MRSAPCCGLAHTSTSQHQRPREEDAEEDAAESVSGLTTQHYEPASITLRRRNGLEDPVCRHAEVFTGTRVIPTYLDASTQLLARAVTLCGHGRRRRVGARVIRNQQSTTIDEL